MTSEFVRRIPIADLKIARVKCPGCQVIVEVHVSQLGAATYHGACRHCSADVIPLGPGQTNPFNQLHAALKQIRESGTEVEFVVPEDRPHTPTGP